MADLFDNYCLCLNDPENEGKAIVPSDDEFKQLVVEGLCDISAGGGGGGTSTPFELLCDDNGPFIRVYSDPVTNFTLAGAAYVPVGTVGVCPPECCPPYELLCDVVGETSTPFIRLYTDPVTDLALDGTPYAVVGTVGICSAGAADLGNVLVETVTVNERAFRNPEVILHSGGNNNLAKLYLEGDNFGTLGMSYVGILPSGSRDIEYNEDYTLLYNVDNTGLNFNVINLTTGTVVSTTAITGITASYSIFQITMHPITNVLWAYASQAGGVNGRLYTLDPVTAIATLQGSFNVNLAVNHGMAFLPDGRLVYCAYDGTNPTRVTEIIRVNQGTVASPTVAFVPGRDIFRIAAAAGAVLAGPLAASYRNTIIGHETVQGVGEYSFAGDVLRAAAGSISSGGAIAYIHPLGTRKLFVGVSLRRVTVTDSTGALVSTTYYTPDGDDVTSVILPEYVQREDIIPADTPTEALHVHGTIVGTSLLTTYQTLITQTGLPQGWGRILQAVNTTDRELYLQFTTGDSSTDQILLPIGGQLVLDYGANGRQLVGNLRVRAIGSIPTSGNVYATIIR